MKRPSFYKGVIISGAFFIAWMGMIIPLTIYATQFPPQNEIHRWVYFNRGSAIAAFMAVWVFLGFVMILCAGRAESKKSKWYWEHRKGAITEATLRKVNHRRATANDLTNPDPTALYEFRVVYSGQTSASLELRGNDPDIDKVLRKVGNKRLLRDTHITKAQIIAVNNTTVTDTKQGISIGRAILGGMVAGEVGAVLGGLSGKSHAVSSPGTNTFTFLVFYDNKAPETEKVLETSDRFKFLITKLEVQ